MSPHLFGVVKQFGWFWIWSETECKIPAEYGLHYTQFNPSPQTHTVCIQYIVHLIWEGGRGQREDRGPTVPVHKYSSFVHGSNSS